jgi:hypothetical protein
MIELHSVVGCQANIQKYEPTNGGSGSSRPGCYLGAKSLTEFNGPRHQSQRSAPSP